MRTLWTVFSLVLLSNVLAAGAFAGWLHSSGRLSSQRLQRVVDMFAQTIEEEQAQLDQAQVDAEAQAEKARLAMALKRVEDGPKTFASTLVEARENDQIADRRADRVARDIEDLRRRFEQDKRLIEERLRTVEAREKALNEAIAAQKQQRESVDFKQTVKMYEQLKPRQTKQIFQQLMQQNRTDEVVNYLAAMQLRQAVAVIREFKEAEEIPLAAELLQRLRDRGVNLINDAAGNEARGRAETFSSSASA